MAETEEIDHTGASPHPPATIIDMESATTEHTSTEHVDGTTAPAGLPISRHNIRPATLAEAVNRPESVQEGRTSELSTSEDNEIRQVYLARQTLERNPPPKALHPIITDVARFATDRQRLESVREPLPPPSNRSIAEILQRPDRDHGCLPLNIGDSHHVPAVQSHRHYPASQSQIKLMNISSQDPQDQNPYMYRADEIGLTHRIPRVGHLGDFLVPPGWKEGDEPIDPRQAKGIYDAARADAKRALSSNVEVMKDLTNHERAEFDVEAELEWNKQFQLDDLVYKERVKIYETYHQRRLAKLPQALTLPSLFTSQPRAPPNPLHPPTRTSAFNHVPSILPRTPELQDSISKYDGSVPRFYGVDGLDRGQSLPQLNSAYDPRHVPQSSYGNAEDYVVQQARLLEQSNQTSENLSNWLAQLSPNLVQELKSAIIRSPLFNELGGQFWNTQASSNNPGMVDKPKLPKPQPNMSPIDGRPVGSGSFTPHISRTLGQSHRSVIPVHPSDTSHTHGAVFDENPLFRQNVINLGDRTVENDEGIDSEQTNPMNTAKKARKTRAKPEKPKVWYHEDLAKANLPTSTISRAAMQAGLDYAKIGKEPPKSDIQASNVTKPRRRRKEAVDPSVGIAVSKAAARVLIAHGARDTMNLRNSGFLNDDTPSSLSTSQPTVQGSMAAVPAYYSPYTAKPSIGQAGSLPATYILAANRQPVPSLTVAANRNAVSRNSAIGKDPDETLSSPEKDDPKDTSFNTRSQRSKAPSSAKKRKSVTTTKASKRSRNFLDRAEDDDMDHERTYPKGTAIDLTETPRERAARRMSINKDYDSSPLSRRPNK